VPIGANLSDFLFVHRPHAPPGGAPIWTALTVKTGEYVQITGIFCSDRESWPRTHYLYPHTCTFPAPFLRHQADTHNRSPSPRSPILHHPRCAPPSRPTFPLHAALHPRATCLSDVCIDTSTEALVLERLLRDLGITGPSRGAFTLLGPDSIYQISL